MVEILNVLDNREKAALIWVAFIITIALFSKGMRSSVASASKILLSKPLLIVLGAMVSYVALIVYGLERAHFWDFSLTKDTVIWFLGPAMLMVFNHSDANKDADYFRRTLSTNLRLALILEFLISFYVFYLVIEIMLLPFMFILVGMFVVSEANPEYAQVKRFLEFLISVVGLLLLSYAIAMLIGDLGAFVTASTIKLFALPIALTLLFVPFIYALAIYSGYESIFVRISIWIRDKELADCVRRQVLAACLFRLSRVNRFLNEYVARLQAVKSESEAIELFAQFRRH